MNTKTKKSQRAIVFKKMMNKKALVKKRNKNSLKVVRVFNEEGD